MKETSFKILSPKLLDEYCAIVIEAELNAFENLEESEISIDSFSFYTSVSAVFSSKIEGENIELDSYVKHKRFGIKYLPDYTKKIDDLYNTYQFAKKEECNKANIATAHAMLTKNILPKSTIRCCFTQRDPNIISHLKVKNPTTGATSPTGSRASKNTRMSLDGIPW